MPRILYALPILLVAASACLGDEPKWFLQTKVTDKVLATLPYGVTLPKMKATDWILVVPQLPELPGQTKVKSSIVSVPAGSTGVVVKEKGALGRNLLVLRVPAKTPDLKTSFNALITYEATLRYRVLKELEAGMKAPKVADLPAAERKKALSATAAIDFETPTFKKWLADENLVRGASEIDIDFARRVFLALRQYLTFTVAGKIEHKASAVALAKKSDDLGMNNLYVAVLRANKIPSRALVGRWADAAIKGKYYQWQTMSEFFADGVGWVPTDVSSNVRREAALEGLACFGRDVGHFIVFHVDTDMQADVPMMGLQKFEALQSPGWFVRGDGTADGPQFREDWKVERVP